MAEKVALSDKAAIREKVHMSLTLGRIFSPVQEVEAVAILS